MAYIEQEISKPVIGFNFVLDKDTERIIAVETISDMVVDVEAIDFKMLKERIELAHRLIETNDFVSIARTILSGAPF